MFNKKNKSVVSLRQRSLFSIHKMLNTSIDREIKDLHDDNLWAFIYGFYEMLPIYITVIALYIWFSKFYPKIVVRIYLLILLIVAIGLFGYKSFENIASGITRVIGFYLLFLVFLLLCFNLY
jgi:hypothetical protein